MKKRTRTKNLQKRKRRIRDRLRPRSWKKQDKPMLAAENIHYEVSDRTRALGVGGIGVMHQLARQSGLVAAIDRHLNILKVHLPYHESDHVLNMAYNILSGGDCLEDIELRRNDEAYLDALGTQRIPDPTTAGDFCRRFSESDIDALTLAIHETRLRVWARQEPDFFREAILDADGTMAPTTGECKQGMDISYDGTWGYHPLVISLANTNEPLYLFNRSANRPSHEGAAARFDDSIALCRKAGFESILLRGDTDFSQTQHLDRWDDQDVGFLFGIDAMKNLVQLADKQPETAWKPFPHKQRPQARTPPRTRPQNVKERIVVERKFKNIQLQDEHVSEFAYSPGACDRLYRLIVLRKNLTVRKGEVALFDEIRYFFYISNDPDRSAEELVTLAHQRCNQENLIKQLKHGVKAMRMPVDNLVSNGAYMLIASLAWTLKAWLALWLPEKGRWKHKHRAQKEAVLRMEFKQFLDTFIRIPCQIVRSGRRLIYRVLTWNPWLHVLLRGHDALGHPMRC